MSSKDSQSVIPSKRENFLKTIKGESPGAMHSEADKFIDDEIDRCSKEFFGG